MLESLLIANRGEIARRIIRTARRMGLRTVAVYSDADADAPHVHEADEAVRIGPAPARESYLRVEAIIDAARRTGTQAIHPGYGFLSENPALPRACAAANLVFVGPPADVVEAMGSKISAKRLAIAAGVPVVPGFDGDDGTDTGLSAAAERVGFPLLVKASAGGGGKGMRTVAHPAALADALAAARQEARAAFGDDRLLLERLVTSARHVEVQIAADHQDRVIHLFERDCSVQRNSQKVLEEAPAPNLDDAIRSRLLDDAVRLARSIGYRNLGTMEFLVDAASGEHFFLEMNTRLQVEHPVTEFITGLDLVEWQLRIAAGEPLPLRQEEVQVRGHAIEARLTAERPEANFVPATGRIAAWHTPHMADGVRIDAGVETGSEVSVHYDSMIAKVIAHGPTREEARQRLLNALDRLTVLGPQTNRPFLVDVIRQGPFAEGRATTAALQKLFPDGWSRPALEPALVAGIAAAVHLAASRPAAEVPSPWSTLRGFRLLDMAGRPAVQELAVDLPEGRTVGRLLIGGEKVAIIVGSQRISIATVPVPGGFAITLGDEARRGFAVAQGDRIFIRLAEAEIEVGIGSGGTAGAAVSSVAGLSDAVTAPMPGVVVEIKVAPGDAVAAGSPVASLESMKLVQTLVAHRAGRIARVEAQPGQTIPAGFVLLTLEPEADPATGD